MGQELECRLHYHRRTASGKAYLETDHVLFRGDERLKVLFKDLKGVTAAGGLLKLDFAGGPASLELGAAAEKWAHKILNPPSRADKLGVKAGVAVALVGEFEGRFLEELRERSVEQVKTRADLIFFAAADAGELAQVRKLIARLKPNGGLWVVYPKGIRAITEMDVINAGRAAGLKDNKVASFSTTHTALRFVIPLTAR
jgi:hypothetical protein